MTQTSLQLKAPHAQSSKAWLLYEIGLRGIRCYLWYCPLTGDALQLLSELCVSRHVNLCIGHILLLEDTLRPFAVWTSSCREDHHFSGLQLLRGSCLGHLSCENTCSTILLSSIHISER